MICSFLVLDVQIIGTSEAFSDIFHILV